MDLDYFSKYSRLHAIFSSYAGACHRFGVEMCILARLCVNRERDFYPDIMLHVDQNFVSFDSTVHRRFLLYRCIARACRCFGSQIDTKMSFSVVSAVWMSR